MGRRQREPPTGRTCVVSVTLLSVWTTVSGFGMGSGSSSCLGRALATAAAAGGAGLGKVARVRGVRRPRSSWSLPPTPWSVADVPSLLSANKRQGSYVGEAPSTSKDWRDLRPEEEMALCEQILEHRRVQDLQVELERKERRPVTVQEWAVAAGHPSSHQLMAALQSGRKAERTMVICHQGLVHSVAFRYKQVTRSLSLDDLVQEGNVGLLQAVGRFDPTKETRFSSYAVFRIKSTILRAIANKDRLVRVPVHAQDAAIRILAASHALQIETGSAPSDAQLAIALSMSEENVSLYRKSARRQDAQDLDDPNLSESAHNRGEGRIGGERWPREPSQLAQAAVIRRDMVRIMQACLSPTEERALRLRFGLSEAGGGVSGSAGQGAAALTFKEIGRTMELSAEGIRKVVFRAISKLQESDEANGVLLAYADLA